MTIKIEIEIRKQRDGGCGITMIPYLEGYRDPDEEMICKHFHLFFKAYEVRRQQRSGMRMPESGEVIEVVERLERDGVNLDNGIDLTNRLTTGN